MYAIKVTNTKNLVTTIRGTIYQNENKADTLVFLVPQTYDSVDMANCTMLMRYVTPSGSGRSEEIEMDAEPYNDEYYRYRLKLSTRITAECGKVKLWLTAVGLDNQVTLETGEASIQVQERKNIDDYLSDKDLSKLEQLDAKVTKLEAGKADDLMYDKSSRKLQLTAKGVKIGTAATVPSDDYAGGGSSSGGGDSSDWDDMDGDSDGGGNETWDDM